MFSPSPPDRCYETHHSYSSALNKKLFFSCAKFVRGKLIFFFFLFFSLPPLPAARFGFVCRLSACRPGDIGWGGVGWGVLAGLMVGSQFLRYLPVAAGCFKFDSSVSASQNSFKILTSTRPDPSPPTKGKVDSLFAIGLKFEFEFQS